jgi:Arc/MetJ-type ribon-helix-helix transcriptional regulator
MKTAETKIPDRLDRAIDALVERGWFSTRDEVFRQIIRRFLDAHQPDLMETFVREDVEWRSRGRS